MSNLRNTPATLPIHPPLLSQSFPSRAHLTPFLCPAPQNFIPRARFGPILCPATPTFSLPGSYRSCRQRALRPRAPTLGRRSPVTAGRNVRRWCQILPGPYQSHQVTPVIAGGGARCCLASPGSSVFHKHHIINTLRELTGSFFTPSLSLSTYPQTTYEKHPPTLSGQLPLFPASFFYYIMGTGRFCKYLLV